MHFSTVIVAALTLLVVNAASNDTLLWGPYRPNLYFGVKPKLRESLLSGLMWFNADSFNHIHTIRHECEQGDNMASFGWHEYDSRLGGRQLIEDVNHDVDITTEFVTSEDGESWGVRVSGKRRLKKDGVTSLVFYSGLEGKGNLNGPTRSVKGHKNTVELEGDSPDLGQFSITITEKGKKNVHPVEDHPIAKQMIIDNLQHASLKVPTGNVWKAKGVYLTLLQERIAKLAEKYPETDQVPAAWVLQLVDEGMKGNLHFVQLTFEGDFEFDVLYNTKGAMLQLNSDNLDEEISRNSEIFNTKFDSIFPVNAPFDTSKHAVFAKNMFSNLLGGVGHFSGSSLVNRKASEEYDEDEERFWEGATHSSSAVGEEEGPFELLTTVPSRPFFPRGFYWDEGFHLIPVLEYDSDVALNILDSWMNLMDEDGWIAREQILGPEARSKVPAEFQVQFPHYANPPTLLLLISRAIEKFESHQRGETARQVRDQYATEYSLGDSLISSPEKFAAFLEKLYPKLQLHFDWFRTTQKGEVKEWDREAFSKREGYRWRGRTKTHCLTSGLDDYPRAETPHAGELHVDLLSWIGLMARSLKDVAQFLDKPADVKKYAKIENAIVRNLDDLHWSEDEQAYCDATIDDYEENAHVCHKGYVSLSPFFLKHMSTKSDKLPAVLDLISDPNELWSEYGLRSLSKSSPLFGTNENYWRGPVWMNINYLVLDALKYYGENPEVDHKVRKQAADIYQKLRKNTVKNVHDQWKKTGYGWEQYNEETGAAQGVKHFTGWTSLVVSIMGMPEKLDV